MGDIVEKLITWLTRPDVIQAIAAVIGIIISVVALFQSKKSIELTEKSIREANRPVVAVYLEYTQVLNTTNEYLVIKNFGSTPATIDSIDIDKKISIIQDEPIFSQSVPFILAPNQSFSTVLRLNVFSINDEELFNVKVSYHDSIHQYHDSFELNQKIVTDMRLAKSNPSESASVQEVLAKTTEEIIRKNF